MEEATSQPGAAGSTRCAYAVVDVPGKWVVGLCTEGKSGYSLVLDHGPYEKVEWAKTIVHSLNEKIGVSRETARRIVKTTMPDKPELTAAQRRVLERMPDRPSDGARLRGGAYIAGLTCVSKGWAALVGRDLVGGSFARLPDGRAVLDATYAAWKQQ